MIQLRPYQNETAHLLQLGFKVHKRQIAALPTGSGKTVLFSEMCRRAAMKNTQTLICTDRLELFSQTLKHIGSASLNPQILDAKTKIFYPGAPITVAMVETIFNRYKKGLLKDYSPRLLVIDEAHKGSFFKILDIFPNAYVVGCTATPRNKDLHKYYTNIVSPIDIPELVDQGYLCRCEPYQMQDSFDDVKVVRGEYDEKQLFAHYDKKVLYKGVIEKWIEKCGANGGMKTICFCVNIAHSIRTCEEFNAAGIVAKVVTSKTSEDERKQILKEFEAGAFPVLVNCGILTTGVDIPSIRCVLLNRATQSLTLFLQMIGRGSRPDLPSGKLQFIVLDFGMNHTRHGLWQQAREWTLEAPKNKSKKIGPAPVRVCPQCTAMVAASARKCEFCGHVFEIKTTEEKNGVLVEIKSNTPISCRGKMLSEMTVGDLIDCQKVKRLGAQFVWRIIRSRGELSIVEYAGIMEYSNGWIQQQIADAGDSAYKDLRIE